LLLTPIHQHMQNCGGCGNETRLKKPPKFREAPFLLGDCGFKERPILAVASLLAFVGRCVTVYF